MQRVLHTEHAEVQRLSIPSPATSTYLAALLPRSPLSVTAWKSLFATACCWTATGSLEPTAPAFLSKGTASWLTKASPP